jgi:hypothetical protein
MSGGHFYPEYVYYKMYDFANEVEDEIEKNGKPRNESYYGQEFYPNHDPEVIDYIKAQIPKIKKMSDIMRHIDYLYAGDHGDDSFMERVKEVEEKYD